MILLMIILLSLSVIYYTRLLYRKNMRAAAISVAILYFYLILWIYAIFVIDIADLGFSDAETRISLLHGSEIYHSFVEVTAKMSIIPLPLLHTIVGVAGMILLSSIAVALHGILDISHEIIKSVKKYRIHHHVSIKQRCRADDFNLKTIPLLRMYCRANC